MTAQSFQDRRHACKPLAAEQGWRSRIKRWAKQLPFLLLEKSFLNRLVDAQVKTRTADLYRRANYDALTHLPNRAYFLQQLEEAIQCVQCADEQLALLFLDLDGFKPVNDTYGHGVGDELLRLVAARLAACVREEDVVGRLGGDEFVVLLRRVEDDEIVRSISKRIVEEVSRPYWIEGHAVRVSTSVGIAEFPRDAELAAQLIERADQALYVAKRRGRRQYCFYHQIDAGEEAVSDKLQNRFEVDLDKQRFDVWFRPVMQLSTDRCVGARLDVQWQDAPEGHRWLDQWQPLLKRSPWRVSMGLWMVESAAYYVARWQLSASDFKVVVPVEQALLLEDQLAQLLMRRVQALLLEDQLAQLLMRRVQAYGAQPAQMVLRIALSHTNRLDEKAIQVMEQLKACGFGIQLCEVGQTALVLDMLGRVQVDSLALDGDWLQKHTALQGQRIVQGVAAMATVLQAQVHADRVENSMQKQRLAKWGVQTGEGAAWRQVLPAEAFADFVRQVACR